MIESYLFFEVLLSTTLIFFWVLYIKDTQRKCFYLLAIFFIYFYCGSGIATLNGNSEYKHYYYGYLATFSFFLFLFTKHDVKIRLTNSIFEIKNKTSKVLIILYLVLCIIPLVYPTNVLPRIFSPPAPDLREAFSQKNFERPYNDSLLSLISLFVFPFFLIALNRLLKRKFLYLFLIFLPLYFKYCENAYIGRSDIAIMLLLAFFVFYKFKVVNRRKLLLAAVIGIPFVILFFAVYISIRLGSSSDINSFGEAFSVIIDSEGGYLEWFPQILNHTKSYISNYVVWLTTTPLPGFMKWFDVDVQFNNLFSEYVMGTNRGGKGFYIVLPGLVGESVFIFGKQLFFIHAVVFAFLFAFTYNTLSRNHQLFPVLTHIMIISSWAVARGGTPSAYPMMIKTIVIFLLIGFISKKTSLLSH